MLGGYDLGLDYPGLDHDMLLAVTEMSTRGRHRPADRRAALGRRPGERRGREAGRERAHPLRQERAGPDRRRPATARRDAVGSAGRAPPRRQRPAGAGTARRRPPLPPALAPQLRGRERVLPTGLVHDEVQPEDVGEPRSPGRLRPDPPAPGLRHRPGEPRADGTGCRLGSRRSVVSTRSHSNPRRAPTASSPAC